MTPEKEAQVIDLYLNTGWGQKTVAAHLHVGYGAVQNLLKRRGLARDRQDQAPDRVMAGRLKMSLAELQAEVAKGNKWCPHHDDGKGAWLPHADFNKNRTRYLGLDEACRICRGVTQRAYKYRTRRCFDRVKNCNVRWGKLQHQHCREPIRVAEGATVRCGQPMTLDAERCATCEAIRLLQERVEELEARLGLQRAYRLPSLTESFEHKEAV